MTNTLDPIALEAAAKVWHKELTGKAYIPWEQCGEGWRYDVRKQTAQVIQAYKDSIDAQCNGKSD